MGVWGHSVLSFGDKKFDYCCHCAAKKTPEGEIASLGGIVGDLPPFTWDFQPQRKRMRATAVAKLVDDVLQNPWLRGAAAGFTDEFDVVGRPASQQSALTREQSRK